MEYLYSVLASINFGRGPMRSIFLDFSTTTPIAASVRESMLPFLDWAADRIPLD